MFLFLEELNIFWACIIWIKRFGDLGEFGDFCVFDGSTSSPIFLGVLAFLFWILPLIFTYFESAPLFPLALCSVLHSVIGRVAEWGQSLLELGLEPDFGEQRPFEF